MPSPSPVIFPMRIVSDVAVPVSLACRLFGNMLGGLIVMDLLKGAAEDIPSVSRRSRGCISTFSIRLSRYTFSSHFRSPS